MKRLDLFVSKLLLAALSFPYRSLLELAGIGLLVVAAYQYSTVAGIVALGISLIVVANFGWRRDR